MAQPCPRINPLHPPTLPRDLPSLLQYGATCMPGTATANGCADSQKYWAVVIPWSLVESDTPTVGRSWTAPGGNRYWANTNPGAPITTPTGRALLRLMAERSRMHTNNVFKNWKEYKNLTMEQVVAKTQGKLAFDYGVVHVEIRPQPGEKAASFAQRGGYMLWIDPETGPFTSNVPIDWYKPSWLPSDIFTCQLFGYYDIPTASVQYSVRVDFKETWKKARDAVAGGIQWGFDKFCATVTGEKAQQAEVAVNMYQDLKESKPPSSETKGFGGFGGTRFFGGTRLNVLSDATTDIAAMAGQGAAIAMVTNPYAAAWLVAKTGCARYTRPPEPCEPRTDQPLPPTAPTITATGGWKGSTASGSSVAATIPTRILDPRLFSIPSPQPQPFPSGTIAWLDVNARSYRIAVPQPSSGVTHKIAQVGLSQLPPGVMLVNTYEWDKATSPFWQRETTKAAASVAGVSTVALLGGLAFALFKKSM